VHDDCYQKLHLTRQKPWLFLSLAAGLITVTVYCMVCCRQTLTSYSVQNILARVVVGAPWTSSSLNIRGKHFIPLSLSTSLNSFLTIFRPDPYVLPIQISLPDHPVLLATFPLGPFLCLHLLLGTIYLHTFVLSTPYPPLNATQNSIFSSLPLPFSHPV